MNTPVHDPDTVLAFIKGYRNDHGFAPSVRDIMHGCGMASTSVAYYHLQRLEQQGKVKVTPGIARGVVIVE